MKPKAEDLLLALIERVKEQGGAPNKTKLLKLLYLADVENFRLHRETLTGFSWIFYLYGPWTREYDELLGDLEHSHRISLIKWRSEEVEGAQIEANESKSLNEVVPDSNAFFRIQRQADTWANQPLSALLDYVYFETEPMEDAVAGKPLDFTRIDFELPQLYQRKKSAMHPEALKRLRASLEERRRSMSEHLRDIQANYKAPVYDEVYFNAMDALDKC